MASQAHIFNTSPTGKSLNKAAQGGTTLRFGGINSADSSLDNKTPRSIHALQSQTRNAICDFPTELVHK